MSRRAASDRGRMSEAALRAWTFLGLASLAAALGSALILRALSRLDDFHGHCNYYVEHPKEYLAHCQVFVDRIVPARFLAPVETLPRPRTIQAG